jgi:hypothetical protein
MTIPPAPAGRGLAVAAAAVLLAAGGPPPERHSVPRAEVLPAAPPPAPPPPAAVRVTAPDLSGLSPADRARALADARRWSATLFVGSSVADGKLRDLVVAPWSGSWGDDTLAGGALQYRVARFWRFFTLDLEAGGAYRFGDTEGGELWAAAYLRYDGFPWSDHVFTTFGLSMGPDYVTRLPRVERGTDLRPEENQSRWLNFFSPEITLALPEWPQYEVAFRYMHRSGIFGTYNGVYEGANSFVMGFRYRF